MLLLWESLCPQICWSKAAALSFTDPAAFLWLTAFCTCADYAGFQGQLSAGSCANGRGTATCHSAQIGVLNQESQPSHEASA